MASKTSDLIFRFIGKDETGAAAKSAASNLDHIGSKASGLGKTLAGLGAAVSVGIIASKVTDFAKGVGAVFRDCRRRVHETAADHGRQRRADVRAPRRRRDDRGIGGHAGNVHAGVLPGHRGQLQATTRSWVATRDAAGNIRPTGDVLKDVAAVFRTCPTGLRSPRWLCSCSAGPGWT